MKAFIDILASVLKRPGMFQINNIEDLYFFTLGYSISSSDKGDPCIHYFLDSFSDFISAKHQLSDRTNWSRYIRFISGGDKHSLELFETYFIDYCSKTNIDWPEVL